MHNSVVHGCFLHKDDNVYLSLCGTGFCFDDNIADRNLARATLIILINSTIVMATTITGRERSSGCIESAATYRM